MNCMKEFIFAADRFFASCHASSVLPLANGDVLSAWFGGSAEGNDDVRIYTSLRKNGVWQTPVCIAAEKNLPHWNPVLYQRTDGSIRLFYKLGKPIADWITMYCDSFDGGESWSEGAELVPGDTRGGRGPVKNKCIRTADGLLLAPASTEQHRQWRCFVDISEDDGDTWTASPYIVRPRSGVSGLAQMIQPTLWQDDDGVVHALMRSNQGFVYSSKSTDGGKTWQKAEQTAIPNNNSGLDCARSADGRIWLVYNPVGKNWGDRAPLDLAVSLDNGKTFQTAAILEEKEKDGDEFSYPAIVCQNQTLHITYTYNRKQIVYQKITVD